MHAVSQKLSSFVLGHQASASTNASLHIKPLKTISRHVGLLFDPKTYRSLTSLGEALDRFDQGPGQTVLNEEIRALFERTEGAADLFGIGLLHSHFDMDDDEILVEHGSTSTPWKVPQDPTNFMAGHIVPRSWCFESGSDITRLRAYEFAFQSHNGDEDNVVVGLEAHQDFIQDLYRILEKNDLTSTLGLMAISPDYLPRHGREVVKCERTFGRANVVFNIGPNDLDDKEKRTSIWVFGRPNNSRHEAMLCFSGCMCKR
ncbi:hypothetical protein F4802DRAFT_613296 [Xylaria palmicola]|nr:hypothetical protein F4802DRAFT_613296 [Xylaria palmicola]